MVAGQEVAAQRRLILGLGNPGERYESTRHNLGFVVIQELARRRNLALRSTACSSLLACSWDVDLAMPQTYMNRSGWAARCLVERHGYRPENLLVVYDEVALPLGRLRLRPKGSPGGHRGMESILENLRTSEVPRLRLGIGPEAEGEYGELAEYVLSPFTREQLEVVEELIERAADACECWLEHGVQEAMNRYNR